MDFPRRSTLVGLSEAEYGALAAFDDCVGDLAHECGSARAASDRLITLCEAAERRVDNGTAALSLHCDALGEAMTVAMAHTSRLEGLVWRYTAAYLATGLSILDRLVAGRPPLTPTALEALTMEPTVGRLQELLEVLVEQRYAARVDADDPQAIERYREEQSHLLRSIASVHVGFVGRRGEQQWTQELVAAGRLSEMYDDKHDEPWTNMLAPLLALAQQTPYEISAFLDTSLGASARGSGQATSMRRIHICSDPAEPVIVG